VDDQRDPCVIVPNSAEFVREGDDLGGAQRLAVMAVDFRRWSRRSFSDTVAPCGRQGEYRPRPPLQSTRDELDRRRIAAALLRLGRPGSDRKRSRAGRGW
jgi:hypothetical protein